MITCSSRLELRYFQSGDVASIFESYTSDAASAKYLARKPHTSIEQTNSMLTKFSNDMSLSNKGTCVWVIASNVSGEAIGLITLIRERELIYIHFGIAQQYRHKGYASESIQLAASHLSELKCADKILSFTDIENIAAQCALRKANFFKTGRSNNFYTAPQLCNQSRDVYRYQFMPDEIY